MKIGSRKTTEMEQSGISGLPRPAYGEMKHLTPIVVGLIITLGSGALIASAQGYVPLVSIPGVTDASKTVSMGAYLAGMLKFLVAISGALAIVMAIIGGTQYVAASINPSAKNDAKDRIMNAFIGLALVLSAYLILNSINPKLVQFNLLLPPVPKAPAPTGSPTTGSSGGAVSPAEDINPDDIPN